VRKVERSEGREAEAGLFLNLELCLAVEKWGS